MTPGSLAASGVVTFLGHDMPMSLFGTVAGIGDSTGQPSVSVWSILTDLALLRAALLARDWTAVAVAEDRLISDLVPGLTDDQRASMLKTMVAYQETKTIIDPPAPRP
jgi:hypothetical protein